MSRCDCKKTVFCFAIEKANPEAKITWYKIGNSKPKKPLVSVCYLYYPFKIEDKDDLLSKLTEKMMFKVSMFLWFSNRFYLQLTN